MRKVLEVQTYCVANRLFSDTDQFLFFQVNQSGNQTSTPMTLISQPAVQLVHQAISQSGVTGGAAQSVTLQQLQQHLQQHQASSLAAQQPVLVGVIFLTASSELYI